MSMCGKRAQQLAASSIMLTCYGVCVAFLIIIGDQFDRIAITLFDQCHWFIDRRFTIAITAIVLILPMCYFQRLDFLRYAGVLGVFAMLYVVFINVYEYIKLRPENVVVRTSPEKPITFFAIIPVFTFAYQCHEIVIPVYSCMADRTIKSFCKSTALALSLLFALYCMAGTTGYLTFGVKIAPDIMQSYDSNDPVVLVGVVALIVKMITTYPSMIFCGRGALDGLYAEFARLSAEQFITGEKKRRIIITTVWFTTTLVLAILTPNIGVVIEFLGSLASANVFVFPSLCLIAIARREQKLKRWIKNAFITIAIILIMAGALTFCIVLYQIYFELKANAEPTHSVLC
ncbi:putative sodium-coupled neutral amino acid transporter 7-like protein [Dinothrombium tinctorium]|nr:putative sodium-coupled neutral amino acid transporter 7-like protein [Dinothrombium tinctorium]RWS09671.1 putative sodium-coupled neutral amino acid transporter 7-like protein [Dinothrombium tinctorium]